MGGVRDRVGVGETAEKGRELGRGVEILRWSARGEASVRLSSQPCSRDLAECDAETRGRPSSRARLTARARRS